MNNSAPAFSIITVCLNNLEGLKKTAASLAMQTATDFEWIIMDGASHDGTYDYLKTLNARWSSEKDDGIYDAMNKGLERAHGTYLLFLNAGDQLATSGTLEHLHKAVAENPALIYGDSLEQSDKGEPTFKPARRADNLALGLFTHHQAMLYNRITLGDLRYDLYYKIAADYDLTAKLLKKAPQALYVPGALCIFESDGISQQQAKQGRREQFEIRKKLKICNPVQNRLILLGQTMIWNFRQTFPNLYWSMKSRRAAIMR